MKEKEETKKVSECSEKELSYFCAYYRKPCSDCPLFINKKGSDVICYFNTTEKELNGAKYKKILDKKLKVSELSDTSTEK